MWEFIIRHWDAILESDIATYAGFDSLCASSVFVSWMKGKGSKSVGVIKWFFTIYWFSKYCNSIVVTDTISRDLFAKLFYTKKHLIQSTFTRALLYERPYRYRYSKYIKLNERLNVPTGKAHRIILSTFDVLLYPGYFAFWLLFVGKNRPPDLWTPSLIIGWTLLATLPPP